MQNSGSGLELWNPWHPLPEPRKSWTINDMCVYIYMARTFVYYVSKCSAFQELEYKSLESEYLGILKTSEILMPKWF